MNCIANQLSVPAPLILSPYLKQEIGEIKKLKKNQSSFLPFYISFIQAGLPSPTDEFSEGSIDLNDYLLPHKETTFYVRVTGESMLNIGIFPGDMLIVDRSISPIYGHIVIALVNGEMTVKRLEKISGKIYLCAENDEYPDIYISEFDNFAIWGVVTNVIHSLIKMKHN